MGASGRNPRRGAHAAARRARSVAPTRYPAQFDWWRRAGSDDVRRALLTLPRQQRAVIALHYLEDRPVAEIAALLGCSEGTVKTHLSRGRAALATALGEEVVR